MIVKDRAMAGESKLSTKDRREKNTEANTE